MAGFDAFISYSRRASSMLATDLQTAVERFAKPFYRLRAVRVFRDDASMSANPALWSTIEQGLQEAEWLVLLASPAAAQSQYVANEVTWWREHKSSDRIIIVLEEGVDIAWDRAANDFDFAVTDSVPRALGGAFAEEPRWIDLRWYESTGSHGKEDPRWPERVADIAAAVRGAERDQLIGENVRQHKRAQLLLRGGIAALSLLLVASLVASFIAVGQRSEAQRQRDEAQDQRDEAVRQATIALARQLAAQAVSLAPTDLQTASLLAVQAFRTHEDAQTRAALFQVATASPQLVRTLAVGAPVTATAVTPDGVVVTGDATGQVMKWEGDEASRVAELDGKVASVTVSADGTHVVAATDTRVVLWDGQTTDLEGLEDVTEVAISPDGLTVAAAGVNEGKVVMWSDAAGATTATGVMAGHLKVADFGVVTLAPFGGWTVLDPKTGRTLGSGGLPILQNTSATAISADGSTFAAAPRTAGVQVWRGEATFDDNLGHNAFADAESIGDEILLSATGSLVARVGRGVIEVAPVRGLGDPSVRPKHLEGAGVRGDIFRTASFGGDRFIVSGNGSSALVWDVTQLYRFGQSIPTPVPVGCTACGPGRVSVSPGGTRVLMWATGDVDTGPVVVDLATGEASRLDPSDSLGLDGLAWDGEGRIVGFSGSDSSLVGLDPGGREGPTPIAPVAVDDRVMDIVIAGGEARLLTRDGSVLAVDLVSGDTERVDSLRDDERAKSAYYWRMAPDGSTAYIATYDPTFTQRMVLVVDPEADQVVFAGPGIGAAYDAKSVLHVFDGSQAGTLRDGRLLDAVQAAGVQETPAPLVSPDGSVVVTGGTTTDIELLDLTRQGARLGTIPVPKEDNVYPVSAFTPDGATLVTALPPMETSNTEPTLRTLSLDPDDWIAAACAVGARDLTEEDWARYGVGPAPDDLRCVQ